MPIRSFLQPGAFEPEAIAAMSEALEATLKELQDTGQAVAPEVIAGRIIAAARLAWISTERNRPNIQIAKRFPFGITTPMRKDSKNGHSRGRFVRPIPVRGNPG